MVRESTRFVVDSFSPTYLEWARRKELHRRARTSAEALRHCELCPRACGTDRSANTSGFCQIAHQLAQEAGLWRFDND